MEIEAHEGRLCELIDGVLVEKAIGWYESLVAGYLVTVLNNFVLPRNLGFVSGPDGMMRLLSGQIRIPDVAFVSRARLPGGKPPPGPVPTLYPDLAIEVMSETNTESEMRRKCGEYFTSGTQLIWIVNPAARTVESYRADDQNPITRLETGDELTGETLLPGFSVNLRDVFAVMG